MALESQPSRFRLILWAFLRSLPLKLFLGFAFFQMFAPDCLDLMTDYTKPFQNKILFNYLIVLGDVRNLCTGNL